MNPCDHPHGGGEGKSPIGRPSPVTPWGKPAMGYKTRKKNHRTTSRSLVVATASKKGVILRWAEALRKALLWLLS